MGHFKIVNLKNILIFALLIIARPVYPQDTIALNFNSGYIGFGGNFPLTENYDSGSIFTLLNIGIEHTPTNIGFEFSPYNYFDWTGSNKFNREKNGLNHSFFNLNVYWNVITLFNGFIYFGPFVAVNYLFVGENIYWDRYLFTTGGHIGLKLNLGRLNYNIVSTEIGYRNISGTSKFFVGAKIDVMSFVMFVILSIGAS